MGPISRAIHRGVADAAHGAGDAAGGISRALKGTGQVIAGGLSLDARRVKVGARAIDMGVRGSLEGVAAVAGGSAAAVMGATPFGAVVNRMTGGAASRVASSVARSAAGLPLEAMDAGQNIRQGLLHRDVAQLAKGVMQGAELMSMVVPVAGEGAMAARVASKLVPALIEQAGQNAVLSTFQIIADHQMAQKPTE